MRMGSPSTLFEKVWRSHVVSQEPGAPAVMYVDLHLVHEVTSPQAFSGLRSKGLRVRRPDKTVATMDHSTPTLPIAMTALEAASRAQLEQLKDNCAEFEIPLYEMGSERNGIVHVIGPELGLTKPGMTIVCGDSHTSTHGAFGALAFGIGTSEVGHVLATQCLMQERPGTFEVRLEGRIPTGVTAKDIILGLIGKIGVGAGVGHVFEYRGDAVRQLDMAGRMTICNMSIEAGARAGMIAPDDTTFEYLAGREFAPSGHAWDRAVEKWRLLPSDDGASFDRAVHLDVSKLTPMISYGTNPGMVIPIQGSIPGPESTSTAEAKAALEKALRYMGLQPGKQLLGHPVDVVFIGSCNNSRLADLQQAAGVLRGRKIAPEIRVLVVPGSQQIKREAERLGLDEVFKAAGADWREPGCSMCIAMNGDQLAPGQYAVSTSNRNFEGRQGRGGRTFLASPLTAAATALRGEITDPRLILNGRGQNS